MFSSILKFKTLGKTCVKILFLCVYFSTCSILISILSNIEIFCLLKVQKPKQNVLTNTWSRGENKYAHAILILASS